MQYDGKSDKKCKNLVLGLLSISHRSMTDIWGPKLTYRPTPSPIGVFNDWEETRVGPHGRGDNRRLTIEIKICPNLA